MIMIHKTGNTHLKSENHVIDQVRAGPRGNLVALLFSHPLSYPLLLSSFTTAVKKEDLSLPPSLPLYLLLSDVD